MQKKIKKDYQESIYTKKKTKRNTRLLIMKKCSHRYKCSLPRKLQNPKKKGDFDVFILSFFKSKKVLIIRTKDESPDRRW